MALNCRNLTLLALKRFEVVSCLSVSSKAASRKSEFKDRRFEKNPNKNSTLLDLPDYTFVSGKPTPYGSKQKQRIELQREYTAKIIELTAEMDVADKLYKQRLADKQAEKDERIRMKLIEKGNKTIDT